jgi:hypothetical protein
MVRFKNDELGRIWKEAVVTYSKYDDDIYMEGLRKIKQNLTQDSRLPGRDSNQAPSEYVSRARISCFLPVFKHVLNSFQATSCYCVFLMQAYPI